MQYCDPYSGHDYPFGELYIDAPLNGRSRLKISAIGKNAV